jgi:hypothetical protein
MEFEKYDKVCLFLLANVSRHGLTTLPHARFIRFRLGATLTYRQGAPDQIYHDQSYPGCIPGHRSDLLYRWSTQL